ncbi:MAG TPA: hypothetical protein VGK67_04300 [Myxococcales bacterium]|jgi:hypothetical protein
MTRLENLTLARKFAAEVMEDMRLNFERDGHLAPVAFVVAAVDPKTGKHLQHPQTIVVPLDLRDAQKKEESARELRELAHQTRAVLVLTGLESRVSMFAVPAGASPTARPAMPPMPQRTEVVCVTLEHRNATTTWFAKISRDGLGKPTIGKFELQDLVDLGGVFGDFLPREGAAAMLH